MVNFRAWELIRSVYLELEPLRGAETESRVDMGNLLQLRSVVRNRLEVLRDALLQSYPEREVYYVLFPIVAHADELVKTLVLDHQRMQWPALQHELYQLEDAGDVFFEVLETALSRPDTPPFIYEVFLFCLQDGFRGRYASNPDKLADYHRRLVERIPLSPIEFPQRQATPLKPAPVRIQPQIYYAATALILGICYCTLTALAAGWQPSA